MSDCLLCTRRSRGGARSPDASRKDQGLASSVESASSARQQPKQPTESPHLLRAPQPKASAPGILRPCAFLSSPRSDSRCRRGPKRRSSSPRRPPPRPRRLPRHAASGRAPLWSPAGSSARCFSLPHLPYAPAIILTLCEVLVAAQVGGGGGRTDACC